MRFIPLSTCHACCLSAEGEKTRLNNLVPTMIKIMKLEVQAILVIQFYTGQDERFSTSIFVCQDQVL